MTYEDVVDWAKANRYDFETIEPEKEAKSILKFINDENRKRGKQPLHGNVSRFLSGVEGEIEVDSDFIRLRDSIQKEIDKAEAVIEEERERYELEGERQAELTKAWQREIRELEQEEKVEEEDLSFKIEGFEDKIKEARRLSEEAKEDYEKLSSEEKGRITRLETKRI